MGSAGHCPALGVCNDTQWGGAQVLCVSVSAGVLGQRSVQTGLVDVAWSSEPCIALPPRRAPVWPQPHQESVLSGFVT